MNKRCTTRRLAAATGLSVALWASCAFGQVIRLSERAVVEPRQDVHLADIATISGADAQTGASLAETVIFTGIQSGRKIRAESVLMAVIAQLGASGTANQLQLSGAADCDVVLATPAVPIAAPATVPVVATPSVISAPALQIETPSPSVVTASVVSAPASVSVETSTLSKLIMARLQQDLSAGPNDLVVTFETVNPLLDQVIPAGAEWQFEPLTRTLLGTVEWRANLVQKSRVLQKLSVETKVQKHEMVLVAATQIPSGTVMTKDQFSMQDTLLDRNLPTLFLNEKDVIGLEAQRAIVVGSQLDQRDFKPVQMAQTGDAVTVIFMSGAQGEDERTGHADWEVA